MQVYTPVVFHKHVVAGGTVQTPVRVAAQYKKTSPLYEGPHDPFWIYPTELDENMEIATRNVKLI